MDKMIVWGRCLPLQNQILHFSIVSSSKNVNYLP